MTEESRSESHGDDVQHQYPDTEVNETQLTTWLPDPSATDPLIYPGLYAPSGFDIMSILVRDNHSFPPFLRLNNPFPFSSPMLPHPSSGRASLFFVFLFPPAGVN